MPRKSNREATSRDAVRQPSEPKETTGHQEENLSDIWQKQGEIRGKILRLIFRTERQRETEKDNNERLRVMLLDLNFTSEEQFMKCTEMCLEIRETALAASGIDILAATKNIYKNDAQKFMECAEICLDAEGRRRGWGIITLSEAKEIYGDSMEKFKIFAKVEEEKGKEGVRALIKMKEVYGDSMEKFRECAEIAGEGWEKALIKLQKDAKRKEDSAQAGNKDLAPKPTQPEGIREIENEALCQVLLSLSIDNVEQLMGCIEICIEIEKDKTADAQEKIESLISASEIYGNSVEKFKLFAEVATRSRSQTDNMVEALIKAKEIYGNDFEKLKIFAKIAVEKDEWTVRMLVEAKNVYGNNIEKLRIFAEMVISGGDGLAIRTLARARTVYGDDLEKMKKCADICAKTTSEYGWNAMDLFEEADKIYGNNFKKFQECNDICIEEAKERQRVSRMTEKAESIIVGTLETLTGICGNDPKKFRECIDICFQVGEQKGLQGAEILLKAHEMCGGSFEKFKEYTKMLTSKH